MAPPAPELPTELERDVQTLIGDFEHHSPLRARLHVKTFLTATGPGRWLQDAFLRCNFATWLTLVSFTRKQHIKALKGSELTKTYYQKEAKRLESLPPESQQALARAVARSLTQSIRNVAGRQWLALSQEQRETLRQMNPSLTEDLDSVGNTSPPATSVTNQRSASRPQAELLHSIEDARDTTTEMPERSYPDTPLSRTSTRLPDDSSPSLHPRTDRVSCVTVPLLQQATVLPAVAGESDDSAAGYDYSDGDIFNAHYITPSDDAFQISKYWPKALASLLLSRAFLNAIAPSSENEKKLDISLIIRIHQPSYLLMKLRDTELSSVVFRILGHQVIEFRGRRRLVALNGHAVVPRPAFSISCGAAGAVGEFLGPLATAIYTEDGSTEGVDFYFHQDPKIKGVIGFEVCEGEIMDIVKISEWSLSDFY